MQPPDIDRTVILGVSMTACGLRRTIDLIAERALAARPMTVSSLAVHGLVTAVRDERFRRMLETFDILAADGQPVRWLLNRGLRQSIPERVCGTDLLEGICARAARDGIGLYLYGSTPSTVGRLRARLLERHPGLRIVAQEPSLFRPLTAAEDEALVERVNRSGAGILFLGLGCPLQEGFAYAHRTRFMAVQVCVGAAFDICAGLKNRAPTWMRHAWLEWLYRLSQEPRRLWRRYTLTNAWFAWLLVSRGLMGAWRRLS